MSATVHIESGVTVCNLGPVEQIPLGEGRMVQLGRFAVAVFRARDGRVLATQALCPHREGPLADGLIGDGNVVCPLHSYKFSLVTGQPIGNECEALKIYPVSLSETGDILLALNDHSSIEGASIYEQSQPGACSTFGSANE